MGCRLSIITPVFNGIRFIEDCIRNVIDQQCPEAEHIIIDGGSTDGTVEIIRQYAERYDHIRWISEPDRGQSDAMNKGIALARGEIVGFLNVDDYYEQDVLNRIVERFSSLTEPTLLVGNCNVRGDDGEILGVNRPAHLKFTRLLVADEARYPFPINPVAYFYHRSLHDHIGPYDIDQHYTLDIDFILRAVCSTNCVHLDRNLGNYRFIAGTKTFEDFRSGVGEIRFAEVLNHYRQQLPWWQRLIVKGLMLRSRVIRKNP